MLLNLSNHPSTSWPENQMKAAISQFEAVTDMPHPVIDPESDTDDVLLVAEDVYASIRKVDPQDIHLMGEHTFCHALIPMLQNAGYPVWCSTTKRSVSHISETEVRRTFTFVRFRKYPAATLP